MHSNQCFVFCYIFVETQKNWMRFNQFVQDSLNLYEIGLYYNNHYLVMVTLRFTTLHFPETVRDPILLQNNLKIESNQLQFVSNRLKMCIKWTLNVYQNDLYQNTWILYRNKKVIRDVKLIWSKYLCQYSWIFWEFFWYTPYCQVVADLGEGPGGPAPPLPYFR